MEILLISKKNQITIKELALRYLHIKWVLKIYRAIIRIIQNSGSNKKNKSNINLKV